MGWLAGIFAFGSWFLSKKVIMWIVVWFTFGGVVSSLVAWWISIIILKIPTFRKKGRLRKLLIKEKLFRKKGKWEEALKICQDVVCKLREKKEFLSEQGVAKVFIAKGNCLKKLDRLQEAIVAYDEVIREFGTIEKLPLRESVMEALVGKGDCLVKVIEEKSSLRTFYEREEALAAYDEVIRRCGNAKELSLREQVARALLEKGGVLGKLARWEEALAV
ncbi:MAG: hypothetical protein J6P29_04530, partial [Acetobacter sp.]|nr:hypothetical protein [Acetobacter sp.]